MTAPERTRMAELADEIKELAERERDALENRLMHVLAEYQERDHPHLIYSRLFDTVIAAADSMPMEIEPLRSESRKRLAELLED